MVKPISFVLAMKTRASELDKLFEFEEGAVHLESELKSKRPCPCIFFTILVGQTIHSCVARKLEKLFSGKYALIAY